MKGKCSFQIGAVQHVYQRTHGGFLIFYSVKDYLVFFTLFSIAVRKYHIKVLGLCLMVDHIHVLVIADNKQHLSEFVRYYTTGYSWAYNRWHGQRGVFFKGPFGYASKTRDKDIRSAIAYLYNNPVEKQICRRPEQSQWNFLPYMTSRHPFSEPLRLAYAGAPLRRAIREIRTNFASGKPLTYAQLNRLSRNLSSSEQRQLTDYIIWLYNCIDYAAVSNYFGGYPQMITAINTAKGSEYSIPEDFTSGSDRIYSKMTQFLLDTRVLESIDDLMRMGQEEREAFLDPLCRATGASARKVAKFLHLK